MDPKKVTDVALLNVEQRGDLMRVKMDLTMEDGSTISGTHTFPTDTLEWRAAEYGIDPTDLDTLLDIVLYEPFMEDPDRPDLLLHEAPTVEEARAYHLSRVEAVKNRSVMARANAPDPVREVAMGMAVMNDEAVGLKTEIVTHVRDSRKRERLARSEAVGAPVDRIEMLRTAVKAQSAKLEEIAMEGRNGQHRPASSAKA